MTHNKSEKVRVLKGGKQVFGPMERGVVEELLAKQRIAMTDKVSVADGPWIPIAEYLASKPRPVPPAPAPPVPAATRPPAAAPPGQQPAQQRSIVDPSGKTLRVLCQSKVYGPMSRAQVVDLIGSGRFKRDDLISVIGGPWMPMEQFFAPANQRPATDSPAARPEPGAASPPALPGAARPGEAPPGRSGEAQRPRAPQRPQAPAPEEPETPEAPEEPPRRAAAGPPARGKKAPHRRPAPPSHPRERSKMIQPIDDIGEVPPPARSLRPKPNAPARPPARPQRPAAQPKRRPAAEQPPARRPKRRRPAGQDRPPGGSPPPIMPIKLFDNPMRPPNPDVDYQADVEGYDDETPPAAPRRPKPVAPRGRGQKRPRRRQSEEEYYEEDEYEEEVVDDLEEEDDYDDEDLDEDEDYDDEYDEYDDDEYDEYDDEYDEQAPYEENSIDEDILDEEDDVDVEPAPMFPDEFFEARETGHGPPEWFVKVRGLPSAPISIQQVRSLVIAGELGPESYASYIRWDSEDWRLLKAIPDMKEILRLSKREF